MQNPQFQTAPEPKRLDWTTMVVPFLLIIILCLCFLAAPDASKAVLENLRSFLGENFGVGYLAIGLGIFLLSIYIAFSRYGTIRLGKPDEKPLYSNFAWGSMMFTSGLAADILFYSLCEWVLYANDPHLAEMGSIQDWASTYPLFHWGPIPWSFYVVLAAAFGFMLPVLAGYIAYSIAEKPGLVSGFVAGAIASSGAAFGGVPFASGGKATLALAGVSSGFLGALVGGFLAGGVILVLRKLLAGIPRALEGIRSILLLPLLGVFATGFLMLAVNIPMAAINTGLNNFLSSLSGSSAVLLGLLVGGMMAVDMGGPVNKAAYVFGTGTLAATVTSGGSVVMAAVMAAGMVPPLAVFVATLLFKDKFTEEERNSGLTNIVMGLSFITEGAIPFGAADPARAIPSFIVGSALTGALVGMAGIKLMAPHGGIFVIALTSNALLYLLFILIGAVVSGILFGFLRKPLDK